jgi:hypothetical protein
MESAASGAGVDVTKRDIEPTTITLSGIPRTKKNSGQIAIGRDGKPHVFPSKAWRAWVKTVQANHGKKSLFTLPDRPYNCEAVFYCDANRGDANGYYQGLADLLEKWGLISNDKWIVSWDGSRLEVDRVLPRVVFTLTSTEK